jgi:hypothetical protein
MGELEIDVVVFGAHTTTFPTKPSAHEQNDPEIGGGW